ncbi:MAG: FkbM family methyltransferase [Reyranella sp.]|uniref:FkbM family methyltransferase n=1 Tax=Reyranella sp. TaxID=1929291 RepID=UPI003D0EE30A
MATLEPKNCAPDPAGGEAGAVQLLKDFLRPYVSRIRSSIPGRNAGPSWARSLAVLDHYGLRPATVFDIGVAYGTYELYRAFPDAHYHLIDPTRESLYHMRLLARRLRCDIHAVALGDHDGDAMIEIRPDIQGATLLEDVTPREIVRRDRVPLRRFDSLFGEVARPTLAKIDVQGAELMVLEGMTGRMASIDVFIVETSTISSVKGGAEVHDVMHFMRSHGFVVADVLGMTRRTLDGATAQLDLMFLPEEGSPARRDRRWAAA